MFINTFGSKKFSIFNNGFPEISRNQLDDGTDLLKKYFWFRDRHLMCNHLLHSPQIVTRDGIYVVDMFYSPLFCSTALNTDSLSVSNHVTPISSHHILSSFIAGCWLFTPILYPPILHCIIQCYIT